MSLDSSSADKPSEGKVLQGPQSLRRRSSDHDESKKLQDTVESNKKTKPIPQDWTPDKRFINYEYGAFIQSSSSALQNAAIISPTANEHDKSQADTSKA